jgi:hypothetical protein
MHLKTLPLHFQDEFCAKYDQVPPLQFISLPKLDSTPTIFLPLPQFFIQPHQQDCYLSPPLSPNSKAPNIFSPQPPPLAKTSPTFPSLPPSNKI